MEYLDLNEREIEYLEENCTRLDEDDLRERFADMIDGCYEEIPIFTWTIAASVAFEKLDPIAYDMAFREYLDNEVYDNILALIDGEYYDQDEVESELEQYNAELAMND